MKLVRPPTVEEEVWNRLSPIEQEWVMKHEKMHENFQQLRRDNWPWPPKKGRQAPPTPA